MTTLGQLGQATGKSKIIRLADRDDAWRQRQKGVLVGSNNHHDTVSGSREECVELTDEDRFGAFDDEIQYILILM